MPTFLARATDDVQTQHLHYRWATIGGYCKPPIYIPVKAASCFSDSHTPITVAGMRFLLRRVQKHDPPLVFLCSPIHTRRDFENHVISRRGPHDSSPFLVMDPFTTQHWFESGGQYIGGVSETTMDMAQNTWLVYFAFKRHVHEQWVLVVVISELTPEDRTKPIISKLQTRAFHIFDFSNEDRPLKDVEAVIRRLYAPFTVGGAKRCQYPPVSAVRLPDSAGLLTLGRLRHSHHTACMIRHSSSSSMPASSSNAPTTPTRLLRATGHSLLW